MSEPENILSFVRLAGRLKDTPRSAYTALGKQESTAEHSWRLALLAMTLKPKYRLERAVPVEESGIVNRARYRVRAIPAAGALVRAEDSEEKQLGLLD